MLIHILALSKSDYGTQTEVRPIWAMVWGCPFPGQGTLDSILVRPTSRVASHHAVHPLLFLWQKQRKKPALALFALWLPTSWAGGRAGKGAHLWIFTLGILHSMQWHPEQQRDRKSILRTPQLTYFHHQYKHWVLLPPSRIAAGTICTKHIHGLLL